MNKKNYIYSFLYILTVFLFIGILYDMLESTFPQLDIVWSIPNTFQHTVSKSAGQVLNYLFSNSPFAYSSQQGMGDFSIKSWMALILTFFGPNAKYFIIVSVVLHILTSGLLFYLSRTIGFNSTISILSALLYLTLFAHFEAYYEPMAVQHLLVVFFTLLVLLFYLKTNHLINSNENYSKYYFITIILNIAASFCRQSILMLPASILCHILFSSQNEKDRIKKYILWLPVFIIYLIYPLLRLTYVYDSILSHFLTRLGLPLDFMLIFLIGLIFLFLIWLVLKISCKYSNWSQIKWLALTALIVIYLIILTSRYGMKTLFMPYYILIPYINSMISFLQPFDCVLSRITEPYYYIQLPINIFNYVLGVIILVIFIKNYINLWPDYILLIVLYLISLINHTTFSLTSRYLVYTSPLFCISFCAVIFYIYDSLVKNIKLNNYLKESILLMIFLMLCIFNIAAIKYTMIRGQMVNTFFIYDDIRTANVIRDKIGNIAERNIKPNIENNIYINNVMPLPYNEIWNYSINDLNPNEYYNLRFVMVQVFDNNSLLNIKINKIPSQKNNNLIFHLDEDEILDSEGNNIVRFSNYLKDGINLMNDHQTLESMQLLGKAFKVRPFLINYILRGYDLKDSFNITGGMGMHMWMKQLISYYQSWNYYNIDHKLPKKLENVSNIMEIEMTDYAKCIFYLSYLKYLNNNIDESEKIFSQLQYLETDAKNLFDWLSNITEIKSNEKMIKFLNDNNYKLSYRMIGKEQSQNSYKLIKSILQILLNIKINMDDDFGYVQWNMRNGFIFEKIGIIPDSNRQ